MQITHHFLSITWASVILFLTLLPGKSLPQVQLIGIDKAVHLFLYSILVFLLLRDFSKTKTVGFTIIRTVFLSCFLYGLSIEIIQIFIPGRDFSFLDLIANSIGIILGYLLFILIFKNSTAK